MSFDQRAFRNALGCFATGVTVVTTTAPDGSPVGITVNSFNSVSLDPPLVLFSLDRGAQSASVFAESGCFAVNILAEQQRELSIRFAIPSADKWRGVDYTQLETGAPILTGCLANIDCRTAAMHDGGDHIIFIGRVMQMRYEAVGRPLVYFRGAYAHLDDA